jgi:ABC-type multidrug transport system fused ATPase/permease subunit
MQYTWFLWSILLIIVWIVVYFSLSARDKKREMFMVSLWTSLLGLTEPLFVPEYWSPPSLFDLAQKTGFDIESLIFSFGIGGLAVVLYERIFKTRHQAMNAPERRSRHHRYHFWAIASAPVIFVILLIVTSLNPIYSAAIAMTAGGVATWYCRPDLKNKMMASALIFLGLYLMYFLTLIAMFPGYVEQVWNLKVISGILVIGVPLEELIFAATFGFMWSSIHEHLTWRKIMNI